MRIEAFDGLGNPIQAKITRVVVYDDHNHPVAVAFQYQPNVCWASSLGASDFNGILDMLNVKRSAVIVVNGKEMLGGDYSGPTPDQFTPPR